MLYLPNNTYHRWHQNMYEGVDTGAKGGLAPPRGETNLPMWNCVPHCDMAGGTLWSGSSSALLDSMVNIIWYI